MTPLEKLSKLEIPLVSKVATIARKVAFKAYELAKHKFPVNVGYQTRFPSIFNIYPQPHALRTKDLKWFIEEVTYKPIEDLEKAQYTNDKGELVPVYDLKELKKLQEQKVRIRPSFPEYDENLKTFRQEIENEPTDKFRLGDDGVDAVQLLILRNEREQYTLANGQYLIQAVKDLYHKPGIKLRARYYTPSNHSIYGMGALQPVLDSLNEFSDIHSMAMQDWFRSVNQMVAVVESAFPYPEDFDPRGGGRLRAADNVDLSRAIMPVAKRDQIGSMITAQSGVQGLIENIVSVAEMTPGTMGTRPYHSTYGGLMQIEGSMARRFGTMMTLDQCETMKQMDSMYWMYEQFMFDEMPFKKFGQGVGAVSYKREDIDTDGEGFLYIASEDPSFGDTQVQRNQALVLLAQSLQYAAAQKMNPEWKKIDGGEVMEKVLEAFGYGESDKILKAPNGSREPEEELNMMLQGIPVNTHPKENATWHLIKHMMQYEMAKNNQPPNTQLLSALLAHMSETQQNINDIANNPSLYAEQFIQEEYRAPGAAPTAPNLGQNLPMAVGAEPVPQGQGGQNAQF
jgi:hypothetical protein